jgi:gliding motility-associated lipoprotein GldD
MKTLNIIFYSIVLLGLLVSCNGDFTPKPMGYMRVAFPERSYRLFDMDYPYKFEFPKYAGINQDVSPNAEPYWINVEFHRFNAKIHISYKPVKNNVQKFLEDARTLAYKHTIKADAINEKLYSNPDKKVYGILYDIKGNAASSVQFFLTDSTKHFIRAALYFNSIPNKDSLAPVIDFIHKDIDHMIETFEWK